MKEQHLKLKKKEWGVVSIQGLWNFAPFTTHAPLIFEQGSMN